MTWIQRARHSRPTDSSASDSSATEEAQAALEGVLARARQVGQPLVVRARGFEFAPGGRGVEGRVADPLERIHGLQRGQMVAQEIGQRALERLAAVVLEDAARVLEVEPDGGRAGAARVVAQEPQELRDVAGTAQRGRVGAGHQEIEDVFGSDHGDSSGGRPAGRRDTRVARNAGTRGRGRETARAIQSARAPRRDASVRSARAVGQACSGRAAQAASDGASG